MSLPDYISIQFIGGPFDGCEECIPDWWGQVEKRDYYSGWPHVYSRTSERDTQGRLKYWYEGVVQGAAV